MAVFDTKDMLDNIAGILQDASLLDDHEYGQMRRGAILRSVAQFIELNPDLDREDILDALKKDWDYYK